MASYEITSPDGQKYRITAPEGASQDDVLAYAQRSFKMAAKPEQAAPTPADYRAAQLQEVKNGLGGLVRGAGSIGATLLWPVDKITDMVQGDRGPNLSGLVTGQQPVSRNEERRQKMTDALAQLGADPNSWAFKGGKLGGEIAGTAGMGGLLANTGARIPMLAQNAAPLLDAIRTGGMAAQGMGGLSGMGIRAAGGAITGAASAGAVNPEDAGIGALVGGALPVSAKLAGMAGNAINKGFNSVAQSVMQSALKPTIKQLQNGSAKTAVDTLLEYGINPNKAGAEKLQGMIDGLNTNITSKIKGSGASVSKQDVLAYLGDINRKFGSQVSPTADLAAISRVGDDFAAHPNLIGDLIPVAAAQNMKQGTYRVLAGKYGQMGSAETEAQKALARGLKEEIASSVPGVADLNALESKLLSTLSVTERRALMDLNKNPLGLSSLAHNPVGMAAFMADRSALFKSLVARAVNSVGGYSQTGGGLLGNAMSNPAIRTGGLLAIENAP